ncbi:QWRF motif-containing protein 2-like [Prosopis cineraria]|uniref:QWRF motif-containing protein 2-like n=1 Tax=Prosopis cineraria TaxID=364024 RepID=UPI00240F044A|nr:QWRF motif-containing protein 2-like [Prosopis cineraria]
MVSAISTSINPKTKGGPAPPSHNPKRTPLLPSEPDNALTPRRPKLQQVTSRYMSSPSSTTSSSSLRRWQSPLQSTTMNSASMGTPTQSPSLTKRSLSVNRSRPANPRLKPSCMGAGNGVGAGTPTAQKMLFTSTRSLSVSFQGESFSIQVSKEKPAPSPNFRKITPERSKATTPGRGRSGSSSQSEHSRSSDQQRWPGTMRPLNCLARSVDCTDDTKKLGGSRDVVKSLQNLMVGVQISFDGTMSSEGDSGEAKKIAEVVLERKKADGSEFIPSDNESVSSGSSCCGGEQGKRGSRGIVAPERFWQEANNRLRQQIDPASPSSRNSGNKLIVPPKHLHPKDSCVDSPMTSPGKIINSRGQVSLLRAAVRSASPSKLATPSISSPWRGMSPSRVRNGVAGGLNDRLGNVPSILSFVVDVRRGKIGESRIVDAHLLRLLYNKLLQWRFVNAMADATLSVQRLNAEKSLCNAWVATSKLRESVRAKRTELILLKQHIKLISILKEQMIYLEDWALLDRGYSSSLSGAIEALKASTLRLPVVGGAKADVMNVKEAICSAMDVMQAMASSICLLSPKVGHVNSLLFEAANLSAKELALLEECKNLLSVVAALQVSERSLKTHILQLKCLPNPEAKQ